MKRILLVAAFSLSLINGKVLAQEKPMHEVYSMMVYNFLKYVQWPSETPTEFTVAVVGNEEVYQTMSKWYNGKKIGLFTCQVKKFKSSADLTDCQVVFIGNGSSREFDAINAKVKGKGTLVITDKEGLGARGSGINFKVVDNKLRFELNQKAIESANLKVAGSLTSMAILI